MPRQSSAHNRSIIVRIATKGSTCRRKLVETATEPTTSLRSQVHHRLPALPPLRQSRRQRRLRQVPQPQPWPRSPQSGGRYPTERLVSALHGTLFDFGSGVSRCLLCSCFSADTEAGSGAFLTGCTSFHSPRAEWGWVLTCYVARLRIQFLNPMGFAECTESMPRIRMGLRLSGLNASCGTTATPKHPLRLNSDLAPFDPVISCFQTLAPGNRRRQAEPINYAAPLADPIYERTSSRGQPDCIHVPQAAS